MVPTDGGSGPASLTRETAGVVAVGLGRGWGWGVEGWGWRCDSSLLVALVYDS